MRIGRPLRLALAGVWAVLALTGCGSTVSGNAEPSGPVSGTSVPRDDGPLQGLLVEPSEFPAPYSAVVLPQDAVAQAAPDLTGIPAGSSVDPAGCKPVEPDYGPSSAAMIVGTDNESRSTISIQLTRSANELAVRAAQLKQCPTATATSDGATAVVVSEIVPPPPVDADDTLAVKQTVTSGNGSEAVTRSMLSLIAQTGDLRVSATFMSYGDTQTDAEALDQLFTSSVTKAFAK